MESLSLVYPLLGDNITLYNSKGFQHNAANIRRKCSQPEQILIFQIVDKLITGIFPFLCLYSIF